MHRARTRDTAAARNYRSLRIAKNAANIRSCENRAQLFVFEWTEVHTSVDTQFTKTRSDGETKNENRSGLSKVSLFTEL